jgi:hypothetical protein
MKKVKSQKKLFWHIEVDIKGIWNNFIFGANSKSKIVASVHCTYASKDKLIRTWPKFNNCFISTPKSPTYREMKIIKIEEIENLTLGHLFRRWFWLLQYILWENRLWLIIFGKLLLIFTFWKIFPAFNEGWTMEKLDQSHWSVCFMN